ncbi:3-hydroxyisobutyrate dehydrogenase family protein [Burkholderia pseudomallei 305]|nr:3-hydroxyisobutyrate dehydrogenase family protein [Burkholderia pseudomallei 305]KGS19629.1 3-hydroxyisobutyrate dehydrogenase family protein [Burkholderia pseudomallei MSHR7343]
MIDSRGSRATRISAASLFGRFGGPRRSLGSEQPRLIPVA